MRKFSLLVAAGLQWQEILNVRNRAGDTSLHIICRNTALASVIERFVVAGADTSLVSLVCVNLTCFWNFHLFTFSYYAFLLIFKILCANKAFP